MLLLVATAAALLGAAEPVSLAAPGLSAVNLPEKEAQFFSDHFAQQLSLMGPKVVTASEVQQLLGLERQKQLMGCSDDQSSCAAEIANALGVDGLVVGSLGKFGEIIQVNLKILSANDGSPLAVHSVSAQGQQALVSALRKAARAMAPSLYAKLGRPSLILPPEEPEPVVVAASPGRPVPTSTWVLGGAGVALAGLGVFLLSDAAAIDDRLRDPFPDSSYRRQEAEDDIANYELETRLAVAAFAVGATSLGLGAWRWAASPVQATGYLAPGSGGVLLGGVF